MSNQKRLSQLSFAAVALLAAALPCWAQTESSKARNNQADALSMNRPTEIAALGNERLTVHKAETKSAATVTEKQTTLSRAKFQQALVQATSANPTFLTNPTTISEINWEKTRRLGNDNESTSPKRITFVPSRGQKLPQ